MRFVAETRLLDPVGARPHLAAELGRVGALRDAGVVRSFLVRADGGGAFLVLEGADAGDVNAHLATLPLVELGLMTYELIEVSEPAY